MAIFYKPFTRLRIALCVVFLLFANTAFAAESLFIVEDIEVDVTAGSSHQAKQEAFGEAQTQAFNTVVKRMLTEEELFQLPEADLTTISSLIKDFEITDEKLSRVRYIGKYTIRFKEKAMRRYFRDQGFGFSDVRSQPILILPLFRRGENTILWSYDNEWLRAWNRRGDLTGLVPIAVPIGDLDDVRDIGDDDALAYSEDGMGRMLKRYQAGEAAIAIAVPDSGFELFGDYNPTSSRGLTIQIYRTDRSTPEFVQEVIVPSEGGQSRSEVFDAAVESVYKALQRDWKSKTRVASDESNQILARVPIKSLKEWADTQKAIKSVTAINELVVKSLSPKEALVDIKFRGSHARLKSVMRQFNITLNPPKNAPVAQFQYGIKISDAPQPIYDLYLDRYAPGQAQGSAY